jgi:hypothetical protein
MQLTGIFSEAMALRSKLRCAIVIPRQTNCVKDIPLGKVMTIDMKKALTDPGAVFRHPREIVQNDTLTREQKIEVLRRWEYDARELQVADEESMTAEKPERVTLDAVLEALRAVGAPADVEHSAPTKQGGH